MIPKFAIQVYNRLIYSNKDKPRRKTRKEIKESRKLRANRIGDNSYQEWPF